FLEAFAECCDVARDLGGRLAVEESDDRPGLLCAARERPCGRRAAERRDELAPPHSITSLAVICITIGTVRPSAFAALRLIVNSYLSGSCTGRSAGFVPFNTRSTYAAERRKMSGVSGP